VGVTNASGIASTTATLGPTAGPVKVRATVGSLSVDFSIEATSLPVATILEKVSGDNQRAVAGSKLASPLTVHVKDQYGQNIAGVQVAFVVTVGDGMIEPASVVTGANGLASAELTLGPTAGLTQVRASVGRLSVDFSITVLPLAYTGGTGTPNDPYQISTAAGLMALGETPEDYNKHFILTADIDLDPNLPGGKVFGKAVIAPDTGTGTWPFKGTQFTGVFDGNGHTISHLTIRGSYWVGLFGEIAAGAQVKRLGLLDVSIDGSGMYIGSLVGVNYGTVTWCYSIGVVTGSTGVGGLAGYNEGDVSYSYTGGIVNCTGEKTGGLASGNEGTITCCCSTCVVKGTNYVGGLLGTNWGTVASCYNEGAVTGTGTVGGLMGWVSEGAVVFSSYNRGAVTADHQIGGLVGTNRGLVTVCYSTGKVTGTWSPGGLIGTSPSPGATSVSFWDIQTSGQMSSSGGTGKTTGQMKTASTLLNAGWDFVGETANGTEDTWWIDEGKDYPRLSCEVPQVKYGGGTGTEEDPYQIRTAAHMNAIGTCMSDWVKHFKLMADIDLSGYDGKAGRPAFNLIGPDTNPGTWDYDQYAVPFTGVFDGNGHTISHLTISGQAYLGLFCYIEGAEIRDLGVVDVNIVGTARAIGSLVGYTRASHVIRCYSTGVVKGGYCVGGLAGYNIGWMTHCYSEAQVHGTSYSVGGLAGESWGPVTDCYSTGAVNGSQDVGGLIGGNYGSVTKCYSAGPVSGSSDVGGLVGISGGMLGEDSVSNSFWDTQTTDRDTSAGGTGRSTAEMQTASTFLDAGWDFVDETANGTEDIWWILEGQDYPRLWWEMSRAKYSGGSGEPNDPYQIATAEDLMLLGESPEDYDKHFILTADIDLHPNLPGRKVFNEAVIAPHAGTAHTGGWPFNENPFKGIFDGNGHKISHLTINSGEYLGLFGQLAAGAEVRNLGVVNVDIDNSSGERIGGLVGLSWDGIVTNCYSTGTVTGSYYVGGLVGYNVGTVTCCYSTCVVDGLKWSIGGLVGYNGAYVQQSYSTGNVIGNIETGGLVGENGGTVTECYSTGRLWGSSDVGGLVGYDYDWSQADRCFWDTQTSGRATSAGGTGKTTAQMKRAGTFLDAGWDFVDETANGTEDIWWILEGQDYPRLWWEASDL